MLKDETKKDLVDSNCPLVLWDYCIEHRAKIINSVANKNPHLEGQVPETKMTGRPHDISNLYEFSWYEWVKPYPSEHLGQVLGPAEHAGHVMSQWVLTSTGDVLPIQTCRRLTESEKDNAELKEKMMEFTTFVKDKFGNSSKEPETPLDHVPIQEYYEDDVDEQVHMPDADDIGDFDVYIDAKVLLP